MASRRHRFAVHRRALGYSQERLAEAIGVERTTVARWERGETDPQPWARPKIAEVLQISVEELDTILAHDRGGSRDATMVPGVLSIASVGRQHVAPELVCYFGAQLAGHYTADRYLGALHLLPVARAQHQVVEQLATVASGELRK